MQDGEIDIALAGAVDMSREMVHEAAVMKIQQLSGYKLLDAAVVFVLKRLRDAERDGDRIICTIDDIKAGEIQDTPGIISIGNTTPDNNVSSIIGHSHAASGIMNISAGIFSLANVGNSTT